MLQSVGAARTAPRPPSSAQGGAAVAAFSPSALARLVVQLPYLAGLGLDLLGWLLSLLALRGLPLFAVQAILSGSVGVTAVLAMATLGARPPRREVVALVALGVGMVLLALTAQPGRAHPASAAVSWGITAGVAVIVVLIGLASRAGRHRAGAVLGLLSGLAFGGTALCARLIEARPWSDVASDPAAWALLAYGGLGLALFAVALQRGAVTTAMAGQCAGETLLPALAGTLLLGDGARAGLAPLAVAGFVVAVLAAFVLITSGAGEVDARPDTDPDAAGDSPRSSTAAGS
ncbi:hypothetical protein [Frankia sp. R82]|uniref:hypothetical protein n=1 Tax=Frankia sp. R82 TaxID=2950553 RepID=UPI00204343E7|nr:hypothetical protein [Frankia sp. R82]MCM3883846.1 hypothetical protein [Frankia sp. R82]